MHGSFRFFLTVAIVAVWMGSAAAYSIFSEDFSSPSLDSTRWDSSMLDGVSVLSDGTLSMVDVEGGNTFLFANPISAVAGSYRFEVDFKAITSNVLNPGTFFDMFTVSLDETLLSVDTYGIRPEFPAVGIEGLGDGWNRLSYDFTLSSAADLAQFFALADQNTILDLDGAAVNFSSDSIVYLDNIHIDTLAEPVPEPVPEPATVLLLGAGLAGLALVRRRSRT
jgi:hypothetical protein